MCRVGLRVFFSISTLMMVNVPWSHAKQLQCAQADMLNIAFQGLPYALARLKISHRAVNATKTFLSSDKAEAAKLISKEQESIKQDEYTPMAKEAEAALVKKYLIKIFEPIKEFFSEIRRCSFFINPLLEKSLPEKIIKKSYLIKFMHSSTGLIEFFEQEITTKEKLDEVCEELGTFLTDINDSLSPETLKAYAKFIQEVKQSHKNMHQDEKMELRSLNFEQMLPLSPCHAPKIEAGEGDTTPVPMP